MTLKQLKNEINGLLTTVAPNTKFYVCAYYWSMDPEMELSLAIYPDESQEKEATKRIDELFDEISPVRCHTPQRLLSDLKKAIDTYKKEAKINYKTLELDEELEKSVTPPTHSSHHDSVF